MEEQETGRDWALEGIEGLMQLLQALVLALGKTGQLDTAEYARLLADWHNQQIEPDSLQDVLFQRMLGMLVDEPEVLLRRSRFQLMPAPSLADEPKQPGAGQKPEND